MNIDSLSNEICDSCGCEGAREIANQNNCITDICPKCQENLRMFLNAEYDKAQDAKDQQPDQSKSVLEERVDKLEAGVVAFKATIEEVLNQHDKCLSTHGIAINTLKNNVSKLDELAGLAGGYLQDLATDLKER